jgi:hypothetical protein
MLPSKCSVTIEVCSGPLSGEKFEFTEHDTFLFGRLEECHFRLPDDSQISRRHFLVEVNAPDARIRDFGSLNGTYVNDKKIGGRNKGESPEQGQKRHYPDIDLVNGDIIKVGETMLRVQITADESEVAIMCAGCGKDVAMEVGARKVGSYVCTACRQSMDMDPAKLLIDMLARDKQQKKQPGKREYMPVIAGYRLISRIGIGGYGAVYLAERESDSLHVAIKVMLAHTVVSDEARRKFAKEIEILKRLSHEHIVFVLDSGSAGSAFYFVMEHCSGGSLADFVSSRGGRLTLESALPIMRQSLRGLAWAHNHDIVHRDLKPSNILLSGHPDTPIAKIADMGLAKNFERAGFSGMTVTGAYAGTPYFMPKEQLLNYKYVKPVSDIWSIGATFYYMLTGVTPRIYPKGADPVEVILQNEMIPIRRRKPEIPSAVAVILDKATNANKEERYTNASDMLKAMETIRA